ncbi:hypothetical protein HXX76_011074 [Chlamydomonas incerta]|uniref:Retinoblastoma-like protein n=1 Tax=Chlamydomonas incerta TaxID=51695 RepID=A0A835T0I2_CHLIN|nr:hypothetical protein HXX76_011074 [Chlamydomonas incerta]|eukprot:KAG2429306.1 hypothetical protein HXX76_011074 [Chlamydomonas incerta]
MSTTHPPERGLVALIKGLTVGNVPALQPDVLDLYAELKEAYEAQERAAPTDRQTEFAGDQDEDVKQACKQASLLFVARVLSAAQKKEKDGSEAKRTNLGLSISRIVAVAGINLLDFIREVQVIVSKLSAYFESRGSSSNQFSQQALLQETSETIVVMGLLAKKYKDNFNTFLHQLDFYKQVVLRLGWGAFLVLRVKLLSAFPDVVSCMELLPCIFAILASHAPRLPDCLAHITREDREKLLLKSMADVCKADYGRVQARMPTVEALLTQVFTSAVPEWRTAVAEAKASSPAAVGGIDLIASPVLEGLVTNMERMNRAVAALEREYEQHYSRGATELDEREFLSTDFTKFASPRLSPGHMHSTMAKLRSEPMPLRSGGLLSPGLHTTIPAHPGPQQMQLMGPAPWLHSPLPMMHLNAGPGLQGTPISEAMGASAWLRGVTSSMAAEPSPALQRLLAALPINSTGLGPTPAQLLMKRVRDLVASVIPDEAAPSVLGPFPMLNTSFGAERRTQAARLYCHSLETIMLNEERTNGLPAALALLGSAKFQRGLIACCIEVVAACYRMSSCAFPKVVDALRIKAFDMASIIGTFVKSIATLPRELKRHLFLIEEKILECLAWQPGSSLYHLIVNVHAENEAAATAAALTMQEAAATAACSAASGDDSQHDGAGSRAGPSSTSGGAGAAAAAEGGADGGADGGAEQPGASSSHNTDHSGGAAPTETAEAGAGGVATSAPPSAAPSAPAEPAPPAAASNAMPAASHAPPPSPKRSQVVAFSGMMSPAKKGRGTDGGAYATQAYVESLPISVGFPPAAGTAHGQAGLLFEFLRKVLKLTSFRLALLCENVDFGPLERPEVSSKVYETIEHALYKQTHLFYNRHIDQVMLSTLYGYCKVHKLSQVSFREIIAQYRKQPQAQQSVFRSVVIEQSMPTLQIQSRADIIAFYNAVFVPAMKSFLLKSESNGSGASGPGLGGDSKHAAAGNSGNAVGAAAGAAPALGAGATSAMPPGLPPLPPRANQSPRGPKLPLPPLGAIAPAPRMLGRSASGNARDREPGVPLLLPQGPAGSSTGGGALSPTKGGECSGQPTLVGSVPVSRSNNGGRGSGSGGRGGGRGTVEHIIPDGLAALLQALDSQQGVEENGKEEEEEAEADADEDTQPQARVTRSGRAARDRSTGRERRSRHVEARDDMDDASMDAEFSQQTIVTGRRQRTPNRRYGAE